MAIRPPHARAAPPRTRHVYDPRRVAGSIAGRGRANISGTELPLLQGMALSELHLKRGEHLSPHGHPDADELCYVIEGEISYHLMDPRRGEIRSELVSSGQVAHAPQGWAHWITSMTPRTILLLIYPAANPHQIDAAGMWGTAFDGRQMPEQACSNMFEPPAAVPIMLPAESATKNGGPRPAPPSLFIPQLDQKNRN